jgi:hypothetical protein
MLCLGLMDEAVDGEGGEAEGGLAEVLGLAAELHDTAGLDTQHGDFVVEAGILAFFEVFEVSGKPCLRALRLPRGAPRRRWGKAASSRISRSVGMLELLWEIERV